MRCIFLLLSLFVVQLVNAKISPYRDGTRSASAISSKNIAVLSEKIHIKIDSSFNEAYFVIEYVIKSEVSGKQIPMLFVAEDFSRDFKVWYDDKQVEVLNYEGSFSNFPYVKQTKDSNVAIKVAWDKDGAYDEYISNLKYFETNIVKGIHRIRVTYFASSWEYCGGWISEKTFRYSLVSAKYWKSFRNFELIIEKQGNEKYTVNIDNEIIQDKMKTWKFDKLPADYLKIELKPSISLFSNILFFFNPFLLSLISVSILVFFHYKMVKNYRRKNISKRFSIVVILGSIIVPFVGFLLYIGAFNLIDFSLEIYACKKRDYILLAILFYPEIFLFYWILFWFIDKEYKRKLILRDK
ncbi:hypothetical protein PG630_10180 [Riemerella anatipestifer]|nr:hypothetical protein [Riemerella anatipestifer]